eukprot:Hpha_TRINITY_DN1011_c0_g1::TRINITY_DN1011_c0_g1_i1::g.84739::m.84739
MAVIAAPNTNTWEACGWVRVAGGAVNAMKMMYIVVIRPFRRNRDNLLGAAIAGAVSAALFLNGFAFIGHKFPWEVSGTLLLVAMGLVLLRTLLDLVSEVILALRGYRRESQRLEFGEQDSQGIESESAGVLESQLLPDRCSTPSEPAGPIAESFRQEREEQEPPAGSFRSPELQLPPGFEWPQPSSHPRQESVGVPKERKLRHGSKPDRGSRIMVHVTETMV